MCLWNLPLKLLPFRKFNAVILQLSNGSDAEVVIGGSQSMPEVKYSTTIVNGDRDIEAIPLVGQESAKADDLKVFQGSNSVVSILVTC